MDLRSSQISDARTDGLTGVRTDVSRVVVLALLVHVRLVIPGLEDYMGQESGFWPLVASASILVHEHVPGHGPSWYTTPGTPPLRLSVLVPPTPPHVRHAGYGYVLWALNTHCVTLKWLHICI